MQQKTQIQHRTETYIKFAFTSRQVQHQVDLKLGINIDAANWQLFQSILVAIGSITDAIFLQQAPFTHTVKQLKGSVKKLNISIYFFFFHPSLNGVLFPMFCLLVEGECQILVF